jgi:transcriptional regulator of nitric oxide reductase
MPGGAAPAGRAPALRPGRPRAALLLLSALLVGAAPRAASAGELTRADLARRFPDPFLVGEKDREVPVWPIFKQSGPPHHTLDLVGYAFESADLAPVPGFSGTPVDLLVAMNTTGEFIDVVVLSHHEPVFLGGVGEEPLVRFLTQYRGLGLKQNITIGSGGARQSHVGSTNVYLDGIAKATASLRIINQSVLAAAVKVARAKLGFSGGRDLDLIAHVKPDLYQPRTWAELVEAGLVRLLALRNRDVERAFAGSEGAGLDPLVLERPDEPFCELHVAMATVPMAGRNLLTDAAWKTLTSRCQAGDHVLLVMARGRCRMVSDTFQRNTVPDRLTLRQSGLPIEMRDLDLDAPLRAIGQPDWDQAMAFRVIFQAGLDPGEPMQLSVRATRSRGVVYPDRFAQDFTLDFSVPARFLVPAAEDQRTWVATWKARRVEIGVLLLALALLAWALARQSSLVSRGPRLRWFRPAFLAFTVGFIGWHAQGQLSIVNLVALLQAALAWRSWAFFLYDPMTTLLWVFTLGSLVVWGRGTFCGWLCPFGALQEAAAGLARRAHLRRRRLAPGADRALKRVKYLALLATLGAAVVSARWSDQLVELEPFKTAITMRFERTWPFVAWAAALLLVGAVVYKAFCRYLCPLGAALALLGRLRRFSWLARRLECGQPCQTCRHACDYQAIEPTGRVDYVECFQCMDCVAIYHDAARCAPLVLLGKGRRMSPPRVAAAAGQPAGGRGGDHAAQDLLDRFPGGGRRGRSRRPLGAPPAKRRGRRGGRGRAAPRRARPGPRGRPGLRHQRLHRRGPR